MGFMIQPEKCPCCRDVLWHCKKCWDTYHHGTRDRDFIPPKWYGQPMFSAEILAETGLKPKIKLDKSRRYKEGDYEH